MLSAITYAFPKDSSSTAFFSELSILLTELSNTTVGHDKSIILTAPQPKDALPQTIFAQKDIPSPQVLLGSENIFGQLRQPKVRSPRDKHHFLPIGELRQKLSGHIKRIDHTGVNFPSSLISPEGWQKLVNNIASQANFYKYPTTPDWPFILPAAQEEFESDITTFPLGREPKFELVYDRWFSIPNIQIDIETDLTRQQVEALFPDPYGISWPELADFFRTVYVAHDWPGVDIRFDVRFGVDRPDDWETGKWLVKDGGRITTA